MSLDSLPPLRDVIAAHGLRAEKKLGQNFLLDSNVTDKIARQAEGYLGGFSDKTVFEIGPGPGGLTRSLLRTDAKKVIAVEFDPRAIEALQGLKDAADGRLEVIQADALQVDLTALAVGPRVIVANLPYNIATPLLTGWLLQLREDAAAYDGMALMFQKEVAQRITAAVGGKLYGRLSVVSQWICAAKRLFDLPPSAFTPPPKVVSSVVGFKPSDLGGDAPEFSAVERITAAAFGQRRKMIRSSLKDYSDILAKIGIDDTLRAENLSVQDYIKLANFLT